MKRKQHTHNTSYYYPHLYQRRETYFWTFWAFLFSNVFNVLCWVRLRMFGAKGNSLFLRFRKLVLGRWDGRNSCFRKRISPGGHSSAGCYVCSNRAIVFLSVSECESYNKMIGSLRPIKYCCLRPALCSMRLFGDQTTLSQRLGSCSCALSSQAAKI